MLWGWARQFVRAEEAIAKLKDREEDPGEKVPGVRLGSMKRIKGLALTADHFHETSLLLYSQGK
jgi:hypothetical protein